MTEKVKGILPPPGFLLKDLAIYVVRIVANGQHRIKDAELHAKEWRASNQASKNQKKISGRQQRTCGKQLMTVTYPCPFLRYQAHRYVFRPLAEPLKKKMKRG